MYKKILGCALVAISMVVGAASALDFSFPAFGAGDPIKDKFADAHFFTPGNDYAGSFFWLPTVQVLPSVAVTVGGDTRYCTKKIRGLYYSNAWGNRLWPLDQQTLDGLSAIDASYDELTMEGALYTSCTNPSNSGNLELYSIYGQIKYSWRGKDFSLSMGRRYTVPSNELISGGPLSSSVQYFNNQTPVGYFYDNIAGLGFIGGVLDSAAHEAIVNSLNSGNYIDRIFSFASGSNTVLVAHTDIGDYTLSGSFSAGLDTLWRIAVLGNVLLSKGGLNDDDRRSILGNPNKGSSIVVSDKMNISNNINQLKRNTSALCRGKQVYDESSWLGSAGGGGAAPSGTVCIGGGSTEFTDADPVVIDLANTPTYLGKTIVVYGRNVILQGTMPQATDITLNLFVDRGNLILQDTTPDVYFDKNGNLGDGSPSCMSQTTCTKAVYLRGNIFVNGLIFGYNGDPIGHKVFVHGRFASLNTGLEPTTERKSQIQSLFNNPYTTFGTSISADYCSTKNCINFNNVFTWECELSGVGVDGVACNIANDRFKYNPFIIIDTNISTTLL